MTLTDEQIKAIKLEGRKIYKKIRSANLGYPNPKIPAELLADIEKFFRFSEGISGYKVIEPPLMFCENCFFGGDDDTVLDLFTKIEPIKIDDKEEVV